MIQEEVISLFKKTGALLEGHFLYTSGRHGKQFLQAARVLQYPQHAEQLGRFLAERFAADHIDLVCGPATGGIVLAYEVARCLGCRAAYTEKDENGNMVLRRGFLLRAGERVLVVEDITTTGGSVKKSIRHLQSRGAEVVGVGVLIDRSGGEAQFGCRFEPLARIAMESYQPENCPLCAAGVPLMDADLITVQQGS